MLRELHGCTVDTCCVKDTSLNEIEIAKAKKRQGHRIRRSHRFWRPPPHASLVLRPRPKKNRETTPWEPFNPFGSHSKFYQIGPDDLPPSDDSVLEPSRCATKSLSKNGNLKDTDFYSGYPPPLESLQPRRGSKQSVTLLINRTIFQVKKKSKICQAIPVCK